MHKATLNLIICAILLVIGLCLLHSCGKRITMTDKHYLRGDSINSQNSYVLEQNLKLSDIGSLKPFDAAKPMIIDGKYYYNVVIDFDKSVLSGVAIKSRDNLSYTSSEDSGSRKETEKTDYSNVWVGLTAVIGTLFVLYVTLKKYIP